MQNHWAFFVQACNIRETPSTAEAYGHVYLVVTRCPIVLQHSPSINGVCVQRRPLPYLPGNGFAVGAEAADVHGVCAAWHASCHRRQTLAMIVIGSQMFGKLLA